MLENKYKHNSKIFLKIIQINKDCVNLTDIKYCTKVRLSF